MAERITVEVGGRRLSLSNLDKVLYPGRDGTHGFTKGEVIDYYSRISEPLLAHVRDRPATRKRYPDGVAAGSFFEKNAPSHTPDWVRRVTLPAPGSTKEREEVTYVVADDLATGVWLANLAVLELHVPQWTITPSGEAMLPDMLVLDLDPGEGADIVECCEVAMMLREALEDDGLTCVPKTSGSKGMQLYAPVDVSAAPAGAGATSAYAKDLAGRLERAHPDLVIARMTKKDRAGKIFIDWSQNNPAKTTVAAYSLRAREHPTVSTPITWDEVAACRRASDLRFLAGDVLDRVADLGDLVAATRPGGAAPTVPDVG
jgi:bifunctional non-homologous end joining protein LigD